MAETSNGKTLSNSGEGSEVRDSSEEEYILKWTDHKVNFFSLAAADLFKDEDLTDVTICCGEKLFDAHKLILSACSPYFKNMLTHKKKLNKFALSSSSSSNESPGGGSSVNCTYSHLNQMHPIIFLKDVPPCDFERLLQFMYYGEVRVPNEDLESLILTAKSLKVKGLSASAIPSSLTQQLTTNTIQDKNDDGQRSEDLSSASSRIPPQCLKHKEILTTKYANHTPPKKRRISASALHAITANSHHEYDKEQGDENVEHPPPTSSTSGSHHQHHRSSHHPHHHQRSNFLSPTETFLRNRDDYHKLRGPISAAALISEMANERILHRRISPGPLSTPSSVPSSSPSSLRPMTANSFSSSIRRQPLTPPPTINIRNEGKTLERKERLAPIRHSSGNQLCSSTLRSTKPTSDSKQTQATGKLTTPVQ